MLLLECYYLLLFRCLFQKQEGPARGTAAQTNPRKRSSSRHWQVLIKNKIITIRQHASGDTHSVCTLLRQNMQKILVTLRKWLTRDVAELTGTAAATAAASDTDTSIDTDSGTCTDTDTDYDTDYATDTDTHIHTATDKATLKLKLTLKLTLTKPFHCHCHCRCHCR
jgi:hypothetical protein